MFHRGLYKHVCVFKYKISVVKISSVTQSHPNSKVKRKKKQKQTNEIGACFEHEKQHILIWNLQKLNACNILDCFVDRSHVRMVVVVLVVVN